jgi:ribosomal protein L14
VKSVGDRIWEQVKKAFLRERVKKEEAARASELIIPQTKRTRSFFSFLSFLRRDQRT